MTFFKKRKEQIKNTATVELNKKELAFLIAQLKNELNEQIIYDREYNNIDFYHWGHAEYLQALKQNRIDELKEVYNSLD